MAESEARLCSIALRRVGQSQGIEDLTEDSQEAEACNDVYVHSRQAVLEDFDWSFAEAELYLALFPAHTRTDWKYVYEVPTACLKPRAIINNGYRSIAPENRIPWRKVYEPSVPSRQVILTDQETAILAYTQDVSEVGVYPALFSDALAWKLAAELAFVLPKKAAMGAAMVQQYQLALQRAAAADMRTGQEDVPVQNEFIRAREG